ncbi:hypothetical protein ACIG0D_12760 [Streptomyces sp. NPDC052773]|jgi:3-oxoacyl-(acyl-carrier-protein) synthase|uniref:hypothetical protein n=1 Tax=Streptomyces sp. NPDC052773 TaxID=3365693 RepID=UPI0037D123AB
MTVPDENRPKTGKTDDTSAARPDRERRPQKHEEGAGRTMQEALEEAGVKSEDFKEK